MGSTPTRGTGSDLKAQFDARRKPATIEPPAPDAPRAPKRTPVQPGQRREKQPIDPSLDLGFLEAVATETGLDDITTATDAEILDAYKALGWIDYSAEYDLATLRGRPVPERPAELG